MTSDLGLGLDLERVRANVRQADLEDLLDRATVYRNGMERDALELIDAELRARGISAAEIAAHRERRAATLYGADGLAVKCEKCFRPAAPARRMGLASPMGSSQPGIPRRPAGVLRRTHAGGLARADYAFAFGLSRASTSA